MTSKGTNRREFIKRSSLILAGSIVFGKYSLLNISQGAAAAGQTFNPHAFLEIAEDNTITVWVGQTNLGQGTHTGIPMIIADELEADWEKVQVKMALAADPFNHPAYPFQFTGGSSSIYPRWDLFRTVGAAAKEMLIEAAAKEWKTSRRKCSAASGKIIHKDGRSLSYGKLITRARELEVPEKPKLKKSKDYTIIGTKRDRFDIPAKVSGEAKFGIDMQLPGMCIATVVRAPSFGAKPVSYNEEAAMAVSGVIAVLKLDDKIAVCAENTYSALKGREQLAVEWSEGTIPDLNDEKIAIILEEHLKNKCKEAHKKGDAIKAIEKADITFDLTYSFPYISHAALEPINCTAHVEKNRCRIWAPTQGQTFLKLAAEKITGLPKDKIEIATTWTGGGFGGKSYPDGAVDAMLISKSLNRPVKVMWTREDDFGYDHFRPGSLHKLQAGIDKKGKPLGWVHKTACDSVMVSIRPQLEETGIDETSLEGISDTFYNVKNMLVEYAMVRLPIHVGFWRSVGYSFNTFITETLIDEMAAAVKQDPVAYRLHLIEKGSRPHDVLELLAQKVNWGTIQLPEGHFRGVAVTQCFGSAVACMAEVSVDRKTGEINLHKIVYAVDCGTAVYPDQIKAQFEGAAVMASSVTLHEKIAFSDGGVTTLNFDDYRLLTMSEVPAVEVHIAESKHAIGGIGEPGIPAIAPAIANAVYQATGIRLRELPFKTDLLVAG